MASFESLWDQYLIPEEREELLSHLGCQQFLESGAAFIVAIKDFKTDRSGWDMLNPNRPDLLERCLVILPDRALWIAVSETTEKFYLTLNRDIDTFNCTEKVIPVDPFPIT